MFKYLLSFLLLISSASSLLIEPAKLVANPSLITTLKFGSENPYREFNEIVNGLFSYFFGLEKLNAVVYEKYGQELGYYINSYLRDLILGTFVYWVTAGVWSFFIYVLFRHKFYTSKGRPLPSWSTLIDQMTLAQLSLFVYAGLPVFSEFLIESGYTKVYFSIEEYGGYLKYFISLLCYFVFFEIGIYWMHRKLHTNKFLYKYVHGLHHKYNHMDTLTPFASIAFNPIDGILQASPYVIGLFFVPVHYFTHVFLLFFSGVWATNIHDAMWGDWEPIMGSKYHTMHHTHYHYNFGQFFIFADQLFGTFRRPEKSKLD